MSKPTSPSGSGPAGAHFESKVGGHYLLTLLMDIEPRALPGTRIKHVQFQGAGDGFPLDDVVVHAESLEGVAWLAEIQVKKAIAFSPSDPVFIKVMGQIAEATKAGKLGSNHYTMAIATAETSRKIDGPYQQVLLWARHSETPAAFFRKLNRVGVSNDDMRTFVSTLRTHLQTAGAPSDDETVWKVLRKLQILVFDFTATSGQSEALVRDRCAQALDPSERSKAGALWSALCGIAEEYASTGGEITSETLRQTLINEHGLKLAGLRQNHAARATLFAASKMALQDIRDQIGDAKLTRRTRLDLVNASLDAGRYVEIRGDAGVGKSGILRALAEQTGIEANIVMLSPVRTIPHGWVAMRSALRFDGTANDLLSDMATSGGATLFLDGADYFEATARTTANDLIREAAGIPGFKVVITARRNFGVDEPSWIDADAIAKLGQAPTITIDELDDDEVVELRDAAPALTPLLASGHPARDVARNLFRLDRLSQLGQAAGQLRTEAELSQQWWRSGDGKQDDRTRERIRILRALADKSLSGDLGPQDTSSYPPIPLDELVRSGTLRDLGGERMIFAHDVFRDWAVASILHEDSSKTAALPLSRPASPTLSRGVELLARLSIEGQGNSSAWQALQGNLKQTGIHGSWHRAALLALVRSELSQTALPLVEEVLFANGGRLLRDLVRTLMAVEVKPISEVLAGLGDPIAEEFSNISMPIGPAWRRLVSWLLSVADHLPAGVIEDVSDLFTRYASATQALDPLAPYLVSWLYAWLMELEGFWPDEKETVAGLRSVSGGLPSDRIRSLRKDLRASFLLLSTLKPDLAEQYVLALLKSDRRSEDAAESVIMQPGDLAKAAPQALADLTMATLIKTRDPEDWRTGYGRAEAFTFTDKRFLTPSPAWGPFLELLRHSPQIGQDLVRKLVTHACVHDFGQKPESDIPIVIDLEAGPRSFRYRHSYYWARNTNHYCVGSALMALEAWGHLRIDAGEAPEQVVADILADGEPPAAYLLVIVDLLLSHFPKSLKAAMPFLGSPEMLAWDRQRQSLDQAGSFDGIHGGKEPRAAANRESLRNRDSRSWRLEELVPFYLYANAENELDLDGLRTRLEKARERLGPYDADADFGDPEFMVQCALNRLDRGNYEQQNATDPDGNERSGLRYIPPSAEVEHLAALQTQSAGHIEQSELRALLTLAVDNPSRSSIDLVERAVSWAKTAEQSEEILPDFDHSILISAMLLMRDGSAQQRVEYGAWAAAQFKTVEGIPEDSVHRMRNGLMFNPRGLAVAGMTFAIRHGNGLIDARPLLEHAIKGDPAAAHGFGAAVSALAAIDPRLPRSVLRCALVGNIRPRANRYDAKQSADKRLRRKIGDSRLTALDAEWSWLVSGGPEPAWPHFPEAPVRIRSRVIGGSRPEPGQRPNAETTTYMDHQAAAIWLSKLTGHEQTAPDWLLPFVRQYRDWTSRLNGAGLALDAEPDRSGAEWNSAYFAAVARCLAGLMGQEIDELCLAPVVCLPDQSFLDVTADLLNALNANYFNGGSLGSQVVVQIRAGLIERLRQTSEWRHYVRSPGYGMSLHLDLAIGSMFLTSRILRDPPKSLLKGPGMPKAAPLISQLIDLAVEAPGLNIVLGVLSTVSVSPDHPLISYGVRTVRACLTAHPDDIPLWTDYGVGRQFCSWMTNVLHRHGVGILESENLRETVEQILSELIRLGIAEAAAVETMLAGYRDDRTAN